MSKEENFRKNHVKCIDKYLPGEHWVSDKDLIKQKKLNPNISKKDLNKVRAFGYVNNQWEKGTILKVKFNGGLQSNIDFVINTINTDVAPLINDSITFLWNSNDNPQIRIGFEDDGNWSYIGKQLLNVPSNENTMNLWSVYSDVIIHEFLHTLGLLHEHQNPRGEPIPFDEQAVIDYYAQFGWDEAQTRTNVLNKYSLETTIGTNYDSLSIMHYYFPASLLTDPSFAVGDNTVLSEIDKQWLKDTYGQKCTDVIEPIDCSTGIQYIERNTDVCYDKYSSLRSLAIFGYIFIISLVVVLKVFRFF